MARLSLRMTSIGLTIGDAPAGGSAHPPAVPMPRSLAMHGLMMDWPLTLTHFLHRARRLHGAKRIVTRTTDGAHRTTYADWTARVERLASALARLGVKPGDRVATLAWNSHRHFEVYFAAPCMGAVLHTVNFRLFPEQIVHVMNHAEDRVVFVDASVWPLFEQLRPHLKTVRHVVFMDDVGGGAVPADTVEYETLLATGEARYAWPTLDERAAAGLCYTSGTTGHPKGCLYTHRALVLHTLGVGSCRLDLTDHDTVLSIVPMFHVNAWGLPFGAAMMGYNLVFPGRFMLPDDLAALIESERVTYVGGVPTIVGGIYQALKARPRDVSSVRLITIGGSAMSRGLFEGFRRDFGIELVQGWGMTETSPVGTISALKADMADWPEEAQVAVRLKQGLPLPLVELRIVDEAGAELPWDGEAVGDLQVRGPWVIREYYREPDSAASFQDGWFRTGDVATIDPEGYVHLVDRAKDLVKSGGEWISSVDLENVIMGHPGVAEAAVIAVAHPKWAERPLACLVPKAEPLTRDQLAEYLRGKVADWWIPDDVVCLEALPKTSVGKFDKKTLRARFEDHAWPTPA
jgi:fatty-acyl-CoA synthase